MSAAPPWPVAAGPAAAGRDGGGAVEAPGRAVLERERSRARPYFSRQNESKPRTRGISSKSWGGGGEEVRHSSVRPSQGSPVACGAVRRLRTAFTAKSKTAIPMPKAPTVDARLQKSQPTPARYV